MFFPFVLLLLTCLANSSHSQVSGSSQPLGKQDNSQAQNVDYDSRQRRLRRDLNELKDNADIFDDNSAMRPLELDIDNAQNLLIFLQKMCQLQAAKSLRVKTPRLGRTLDLDEDDRMRMPFAARLNKKNINVPFKPRLGKRTCICDAN